MSEPWTIDSIAHALPHAENRQQFWRDMNLTPVDQLPDVIARWTRFVEQWHASKPGLDRLQTYVRDHGELPPQYQDDGTSDEWLTQWRESLRQAGTDAA
ncbi:hypothetical protein [Streptomyces smyrnaeus]|uniref:hypothetical protein n=1 Tax=Streptomyces smyrnaeus TaxID=1387713 RepID=UPI0033EA44B9